MLILQQKILYILGFICLFIWNFFSSSKALCGDEVRYALDDEFPYVVSISYVFSETESEYGHVCTGSLVSNRDVLTARHCLKNKTKDKIRIAMGSANLSCAKLIGIDWWLTYDEWVEKNNHSKPYKKNDIAMMRLIHNITLPIQPMPITDVRPKEWIGRDVIIAGWGRREDEVNPMVLQTGILTIQDLDICRYRVRVLYGKKYKIENSYLCTFTTPYIFAQKGDSGAPIVGENTIVGITIAICPNPDGPIDPNKVNLHISTYFFRNFIYDAIQN